MRDKALYFSALTMILVFCTFIWFAYIGKALVLPDALWYAIWGMIAGPWVGAGGAKLIERIKTKWTP